MGSSQQVLKLKPVDLRGSGLPKRLWCEPASVENGVGKKSPGLPGKGTSEPPALSRAIYGRRVSVLVTSGFGGRE